MTSIGSTNTVCPEPGAVVHHAGDARARRGEHGKAVAVVAQDDDRVAERVAPLVEELLEAAARPRCAGAAAASGSRRARETRRRGSFRRRAKSRCAARDERLEIAGGALAPGESGETRASGFSRRASPPRSRARRRGSGRKSSATNAPLSIVASAGVDLLDAGERKPSVADAEGPGLARSRRDSARTGVVVRGRRRDGARASRPVVRAREETRRRTTSNSSADRSARSAASSVGEGRYGVARRSSESLRSIFLRAWIIFRLRFALGFS